MMARRKLCTTNKLVTADEWKHLKEMIRKLDGRVTELEGRVLDIDTIDELLAARIIGGMEDGRKTSETDDPAGQ
jgi:hypothetical protein